MHSLFRALERRAVATQKLDALEVFGGHGGFHTVDYANQVRSLEVWENDPTMEQILRRTLPRASIRILDSYSALRTTSQKYSFIVVDNPSASFGPNDKYCEHFELFPDIFNAAARDCVLVLCIVSSASDRMRRRYPYVFTNKHLERRASFYNSSTPERIAIADMVPIYERWAARSGFRVRWWFWQHARDIQCYLVLQLCSLSEPSRPPFDH